MEEKHMDVCSTSKEAGILVKPTVSYYLIIAGIQQLIYTLYISAISTVRISLFTLTHFSLRAHWKKIIL